MIWSDFYLFCFIVGFSLSVLSFLAGAVHIHLPFKAHMPFHGATRGGVAHSHDGIAKSTLSHSAGHISWFNASTVMAFPHGSAASATSSPHIHVLLGSSYWHLR
jgi:hypothetical protein